MNMKLTLNRLIVAISMACTAPCLFAAQGGSELSNTVKGYYPYLDSVGSKIVAGGFSTQFEGNPAILPQVGTIVEVPTYVTAASDPDDIRRYSYKDNDLDPDTTQRDGVEVKWFIVRPKNGKVFAPINTPFSNMKTNPDPTWVTNWDDIEISDEITGNNLVRVNNNYKSWALKVPYEATFNGETVSTIGLRIAFTIVPKSEYGDPIIGHKAKAFDLNFLYGQDSPILPGDKDDKAPDNGKIVESNPNEGGGPIQGGSPVIFTLYDTMNTPDKSDDVILTPKDVTKVRHTYRVEVLLRESLPVPDGQPKAFTYRPLKPEEYKNIKWQLWDPTQMSNAVNYDQLGQVGFNGLLGSFNLDESPDPTRFQQLDKTLVKPDGSFDYATGSQPSYDTFTTQDFNPNAFAKHSIHQSEQGLLIRVIYDDGQPNEEE